ncbi:MAG: hypothetical protein BEN18_07495 [Epulopiscium sp. Nuni2H_MBin001]|nr:MAG: hypothetical protein BEN18_07495 [Epulopiscium sp. Nuni2H_MBin001]
MKKQLKNFCAQVPKMKSMLPTEEATKTALVLPFFQILGYNIFNPQEFIPEYVADLGLKKGEKIDYAIIQNGSPAIIIEAKKVSENLNRHYNQLYRYFCAIVHCKFAVLTNGVTYQFYTDSLMPNVLDDIPFLTINLETITDADIKALEIFCKQNLDLDALKVQARNLVGEKVVHKVIKEALTNPTTQLIDGLISTVSNQTHAQFISDLNPDMLAEYISKSNFEITATAKKPPTLFSDDEYVYVEDDIGEELTFREQCIKQIENIFKGHSIVKTEEEKFCRFDLTRQQPTYICTLMFKKNNGIVLVIPEGNYNKQYNLNDASDILNYINLLMANL